MNLIPPIGCSGQYRLAQPFSTYVDTNISYTCMAVRKISDILAKNIDPYDNFYKPYGLPESKFSEDASNDVCIISLQSNSGVWVYVPNSFIESYPQVNGVPYTGVALMVFLGALPESLNLSYVRNQLTDIISATIGVTPDIKTVVTTPRTLLSQTNHDSAEQVRTNNINNSNSTDYAEIINLRTTNAQLQYKVQELENYITNKLELPPS